MPRSSITAHSSGSRSLRRRCRPNLQVLEGRVLLSGIFQAARAYPSGGGTPGAVLARDFNGDGAPDLIAINASTNDVGILLNRGDGTFGPATVLPSAQNDPFTPVAGDFDGDGDNDFAVPGFFSGALSIFLNHGDGTFDAPQVYSVGSNATGTTTADFNGDGVLDIAVSDNDFFNRYQSGRVFLLIGRGDGTFLAAVPYPAGAGALQMAAVDLDADGRIDLAVTHEQPGKPGFVSILRGHGDGSFDPPVDYPAGQSAYTIVAADLDADGDPDLAMANYLDAGTLTILDNQGDGTFAAPRVLGVGAKPFGLVAADFDGDGSIDLVSSNDGDNTVTFLANAGDGTFPTREVDPVGVSPYDVDFADFDRNGRIDLVTADRSSGLSILLNALPGRPVVRIAGGAAQEPDSGATSLRFLVTLAAPAAEPVTVHYRTAAGSARAGLDFSGAEGDVTFAPGETSRPIDVEILSDATPEADESFRVELSAGPDIALGIPAATGTIHDVAPAVASIAGAETVEPDAGTSNLAFTVRLAAPSELPVTLLYATSPSTAAEGTDFLPVSGSITIAPGETTGTILVPIVGDTRPEPDKYFVVSLSVPAGSNATVLDATAVGRILDADPVAVWADDAEIVEGDSGTSLLTFAVHADVPGLRPFSVAYATVPGTATADADYVPVSGTLFFNGSETTQFVTVPIRGDLLLEADETFSLALAVLGGNAVVRPGAGVATIRDTDPASASIGNVSIAEGDSGASFLSFVVTLTQPSPRPATLDYATVDGTALAGSDYAPASGTLTFAPGEVARNILVPIVGDRTPEGDEVFLLVLGRAVGVVPTSLLGVGTIRDDDPVGAVRFAGARQSVGEASGQAAVKLVRTGGTAGPLVVDFSVESGSATAGSDFAPTAQRVVFADGETAQQVTVPILDDRETEGVETARMVLRDLSGAVLDSATLAIADDDLDTIGPVVVSVTPEVSRKAITKVLVTFSEDLAPDGARNVANYQVFGVGRDGRLGTRDDRALPIRSAVYRPALNAVELTLGRRLARTGRYRIVLRGTPDALTDRRGNALDGNGDGLPGGDYVGRFGRR